MATHNASTPASDNAREILELAKLEVAQGRLRDAADGAQRVLATQSSDASVRHDLALLLAELGQTDAAIMQMREAHRLLPKSPEILVNLGTLLQYWKRKRNSP